MARIYDQAFFGDRIVPIGEATVNVASAAALYGLSVYTVFPAVRTAEGVALFRLSDHFNRLVNSARLIGIDGFEREWTEEKFTEAVVELVRANALTGDAFVRATVHVVELLPGTRSRGLPISLSIFLYDAMPIIPQTGARLKTSSFRRVADDMIPPRAKVNGAYVNSVLGKQEALDAGFDDCLFLNEKGNVSELSAANIFLVKDGTLLTPDTGSDILEGITRRTLLTIARELGISVAERPIAASELAEADEAFACGTSAFVAPILSIDGKEIGVGKEGEITHRLREAYSALLHGEKAESYPLLTFV